MTRSIFAACLFAAAAAATLGCSEERRPDLIVITVDTLRADHLGAYDSEVDNTPHLDALARQSTLFEHAAAPMPLTRLSHFSILTSLYPREHGVVNNAIALSDEPYNVVEMLAEQGYETGGFVGVRLLGTGSGAERGFSTFDFPAKAQERPSQPVVERALDWLGGVEPKTNFFLWVHLFDPHLPYAPPSEFRDSGSSDMSQPLTPRPPTRPTRNQISYQ